MTGYQHIHPGFQESLHADTYPKIAVAVPDSCQRDNCIGWDSALMWHVK